MKNRYYTETSDTKCVLDLETGEMTALTQTRVVKQDDFIMVFLSTIPDFFKLNGSQIKFLMALWKLSSFNVKYTDKGNIVNNNNGTKERIREMGIDLSNPAIDALFSQVCKMGFVIKVCKGEYMLNPTYFFKGMVSDATRMQLIIETGNNENKGQENPPLP